MIHDTRLKTLITANWDMAEASGQPERWRAVANRVLGLAEQHQDDPLLYNDLIFVRDLAIARAQLAEEARAEALERFLAVIWPGYGAGLRDLLVGLRAGLLLCGESTKACDIDTLLNVLNERDRSAGRRLGGRGRA